MLNIPLPALADGAGARNRPGRCPFGLRYAAERYEP